MLHAGHLVTGRAVIFGDFRLNNHLGGELVGADEIGSLVEARDSLGALGFAVSDAGRGEDRLDLDFQFRIQDFRLQFSISDSGFGVLPRTRKPVACRHKR